MVFINNENDLSPYFSHSEQFTYPHLADLNDHHIEVQKIYNIGLNIFHLNCAGLASHYSEITVFLNGLVKFPDILVFTETHLQDDIPFNFAKYAFIHKLNKHTTYDGVSIFYNTNTIKDVKEFDFDFMQNSNSCILQFMYNNSKFNLICIYRSPSKCKESFLEELETLFSSTLVQNTFDTIVIGDINIDVYNKNLLDNSSHKYLNIISQFGFQNLNYSTPTRVQLYRDLLTETLLDHILFRPANSNKISHAFVIESKITDHYPIFLNILNSSTQNHLKNSSRTKTTIDWSCLKNYLHDEKWQSVTDSNLPEDSLECFYDILKTHIKNCTTTELISNKNNKIKPWITEGLLNSICFRDKLFKQLSNHIRECSRLGVQPDSFLINKYKDYRNFLKNLLRVSRNKYDSSCINKSLSNSKLLWKNINNIIDRDAASKPVINRIVTETKVITDNKDLCNEFNSFFVNITQNIASQSSNITVNPEITADPPEQNNENFPKLKSFSKIDSQEIEKYINDLRTGSAAGLDELSSLTLKNCCHFISSPLAHIFNLCIETDTFPHQFKKSLISPIHKGKECWKLDNYRPIALLSHMSKILEKCIKTRLVKFLEENKLLSSNQYGFREGHSTEEAIFKLTKNIYNSIDNKTKSLCIFLDIRKAFDTINFEITYQKLIKLGITDKCLNFLKSYLEGRTQVCKINGVISNEMHILSGVPQGSVLGPLIFLMYINSLCELKINGSIFCYADDTALFFEDTTWELVFQKANNFMSQVYKWFSHNKLFLNESKSVVLCFYNNIQSAPPRDLNIKFHNINSCLLNFNPSITNCTCHVLERVKHTKYLGVIIDETLRWSEHIKLVTNRVRKSIYIFYRLRHLINQNLLIKIYLALVESVIGYGIIGWGGVFETHAHSLIIAQKYVLKVLLHKNIRYPTVKLFLDTKMLNVKQLYLYRSVKFLKNYAHLFEKNKTDFNLRSNRLFKVPHVTTKLGHSHFSFIGPKYMKHLYPILFTQSKCKINSDLRLWIRSNINNFEL